MDILIKTIMFLIVLEICEYYGEMEYVLTAGGEEFPQINLSSPNTDVDASDLSSLLSGGQIELDNVVEFTLKITISEETRVSEISFDTENVRRVTLESEPEVPYRISKVHYLILITICGLYS